MFTGIVSELGEVASVNGDDAGARIRVRAELASELKPGDSVAVSGACLTAASVEDGVFEADVMRQTLELTTLGTLSLGQGSYDVRSTFDVRQNAASANISCVLRLNGVGQDQSDTFTGTGTTSAQSSVAMEVTGQAKAATSAQLLCSSSAAADVNHAEITALKVPGAKLIRG